MTAVSKKNSKLSWHEKWWIKYIVFPLFVLLVGGYILYILGWNSTEKSYQVKDTIIAVSPIPSKEISTINAIEISEKIASASPLQRDAVAKNYEGLRILWPVTLHGGFGDKDEYSLMMLFKGDYPWVLCKANLDNYPELKIIEKDKAFKVEGIIASADSGQFKLNSCKFYFN